MDMNAGALNVQRQIADYNPYESIAQTEQLTKLASVPLRAMAAFNKSAIDSFYDGIELGRNIFYGMWGMNGGKNTLSDKLLDLAHQESTRVCRAIEQVTKPIEPVQLPVKLTPTYQDEHVILQRATLRSETQSKPNKQPMLFTIPVMRGPELLLSQHQSKPEELTSVVKAACLENFDVYITDWKNPDEKTRFHGFREYFDSTHKMVDWIKTNTNQTPFGSHICNFGYMALTALGEKPDSMFPNVLAGAPINIVDSGLAELAQKTAIEDVDKMLRANNWMLKGDDMVRFWKYGTGKDRAAQLFAPLNMYARVGDPNFDPEKFDKFNRWLNLGTRDVPGTLYREIFDWVFKKNLLMKPKGILGIDISQYRQSLGILTGGADDISPPHQCLAALGIVGTPTDLTKHWNVPKKGHSGIYISRESVVNYWQKQIFPWMRKMKQESEAIAQYKALPN